MKIVTYGLFLAGCGVSFATGVSTSPAVPVAPSTDPTWEWGEFNPLGGLLDANPKFNVMIVTELTDVGRLAPEASMAHPVYFSGADGGLTTVGDGIGGERPPKPEELAALMTKSLRAGGFLPASAGHPPTIYIYYSWGSFNKLGKEAGGDLRYKNQMERATLVGGTKFAAEWDEARTFHYFDKFTGNSARNSYLVAVARGNLYFLVATGCDYQSAVNGKVVILWQTRISAEARIVTMDESLPQMVASAASFIGHETNGPMRLHRPAVMEGHVEVGVPFEVSEDLPSDTASPFPPTRSILPIRSPQAAN